MTRTSCSAISSAAVLVSMTTAAFVDPSTAMMPVMPVPGLALRPYAPPHFFAEEYARHYARESGATTFALTGHRDAEALLRDDPRNKKLCCKALRLSSISKALAASGGATRPDCARFSTS